MNKHEHEWEHVDMYFNHNSQSIYDLWECSCGEEKEIHQ